MSLACDIASPALKQGIDFLKSGTKWSWQDYQEDVVSNLICSSFSSAASVKVPEYIRDIKGDARGLKIKGTKKLTNYLKKTQNKAVLSNHVSDLSISATTDILRTARKYWRAKLRPI